MANNIVKSESEIAREEAELEAWLAQSIDPEYIDHINQQWELLREDPEFYHIDCQFGFRY